MAEYVQISTSPGEIIRIADALGDRGRALAQTAGTINNAIVERENRGETLQPDQFTEPFLVNYHASATGVDGKATTANDAVRQSAVYCGNKLDEIGDTVNIAMTNYEATDDESGDGIARTV